MTAVIGMVCTDGVVIAADRQISIPGQFKYHEPKIEAQESANWSVIFAYAGSPSLMREAKGKMLQKLKIDSSDVTPEYVHAVAESALEDMGRIYVELDLQLLIATSTDSETQLLRFDGQSKALYVADGFNCIGIVDTSLIRFFSERLYSRQETDVSCGIGIAIYLIDKAKSYIDYCGGETDVVEIRKNNKCDSLSIFAVDTTLDKMNSAEEVAVHQLIEAARKP